MVIVPMKSRAYVDILDFQSYADGIYNFILVYEEDITKFIILRPLETQKTEEIASILLDILLLFGAPNIIQSDSGKDFCEKIVEELKSMWPELDMTIDGRLRNTGLPDSEPCTYKDIGDILTIWMKNENCNKWSTVLKFIQLVKNKDYHPLTGECPFDAMFRYAAFFGGSRANMLGEISIENEEEKKSLNTIKYYCNSASTSYMPVENSKLCVNCSKGVPDITCAKCEKPIHLFCSKELEEDGKRYKLCTSCFMNLLVAGDNQKIKENKSEDIMELDMPAGNQDIKIPSKIFDVDVTPNAVVENAVCSNKETNSQSRIITAMENLNKCIYGVNFKNANHVRNLPETTIFEEVVPEENIKINPDSDAAQTTADERRTSITPMKLDPVCKKSGDPSSSKICTNVEVQGSILQKDSQIITINDSIVLKPDPGFNDDEEDVNNDVDDDLLKDPQMIMNEIIPIKEENELPEGRNTMTPDFLFSDGEFSSEFDQQVFADVLGASNLTEASLEGERLPDIAEYKPLYSENFTNSLTMESLLPDHFESNNEKVSFNCPCCPTFYKTRSELVAHMKIHPSDNLNQCSSRSKDFKAASNFKGYQRAHTGDAPYQCSVCNKNFSQLYTLSQHLYVHTQEKSSCVCPNCKRGFLHHTSFVNHSCTISSPYKEETEPSLPTPRGAMFNCPICNKYFSEKQRLLSHMNTHW